jgi:hypothetical protein
MEQGRAISNSGGGWRRRGTIICSKVVEENLEKLKAQIRGPGDA